MYTRHRRSLAPPLRGSMPRVVSVGLPPVRRPKMRTRLRRSPPRAVSAQRGESETTGYEPFALHAPIQWAIQGYVVVSVDCLSRLSQSLVSVGCLRRLSQSVVSVGCLSRLSQSVVYVACFSRLASQHGKSALWPVVGGSALYVPLRYVGG